VNDTNPADAGSGTETRCDVLVIGAGFGGLYALHRLTELGFETRAVEAGGNVGGTWYWNRYPGARCDVESIHYCFSFSKELYAEWAWADRFAKQPEILRYLDFVADRLDLRRLITFNTRVAEARFDEATRTWTVRSSDGRVWVARFVVTAVGALSAPLDPDLPGLANFQGTVLNTATWPHTDVDLDNRDVAVVGTGSSGMQLIPAIAEQVASMVVLQRSPNFSVRVKHRPLNDEDRAAACAAWAERRDATFNTRSGTPLPSSGLRAVDLSEQEREAEFERAWSAGYGYSFITHFVDTSRDLAANELLAEFVRGKIRQAVKQPETVEKLLPHDHPIGAKRICLDDGYYETFNLDHLTLVDLRTEHLDGVTPSGIRTAAREYEVDTIIFATGFDAVTGALTRIDIRGTDGRSVKEVWAEGASSYLGVGVSGFPNLFTVTGPGSPSILVNVVAAIEQHVDWIVGHLDFLRAHDLTRSEVDEEAQEWWDEQVADAAQLTVHRHARSSWYLGTNVEGKRRRMLAYAGGLDVFGKTCDDIAASGYRGFRMR